MKKKARKAVRPRRHKKSPRITPAADVEAAIGAAGRPRKGQGLEAAGQAGDIQGLSRIEDAASESVEELIEEGQALEAGVVDGVENTPPADAGPLKTREAPEDDVPPEYRERE